MYKLKLSLSRLCRFFRIYKAKKASSIQESNIDFVLSKSERESASHHMLHRQPHSDEVITTRAQKIASSEAERASVASAIRVADHTLIFLPAREQFADG